VAGRDEEEGDEARPQEDMTGMADADAERATLEALENMGINPSMQREIAKAVRDDGDDVAMACGDSLTIEHRGGAKGVGVSAHSARSEMSFSAGGIDDLKRAQFRAALATADADSKDEAAAQRMQQARPCPTRDPLRWFSLLPPPSLRQAQKCFRRAAETATQCASAQAKMAVTQRRYEELLRASSPADAPAS